MLTIYFAGWKPILNVFSSLEYGSLLPFFEGWKPYIQVWEIATTIYRLEAHLTSTGACYRSLKAGSRTYKSFSSLEYGSLLPFFEGWKPCLQVWEIATTIYRLDPS
jgi:hypothetical protein